MKTTPHTVCGWTKSSLTLGTLCALLLVAPASARAEGAAIIPSVGITQGMDDNAGDPKAFGSLALRFAVLPVLSLEGGVAYRQESFADGNVKTRLWPVTASAWLFPVSVLYVGGGVGWYETTVDYASTLPFEDNTDQQFGAHLGGGFDIPLSQSVALDLNGRYVFLGDQASQLPPQNFNADFWSASAGLAFKF